MMPDKQTAVLITDNAPALRRFAELAGESSSLYIIAPDDLIAELKPSAFILGLSRIADDCGYDDDVKKTLINDLAHPLGMGFMIAKYIWQRWAAPATCIKIECHCDPALAFGLLHRRSLFPSSWNGNIALKETGEHVASSFAFPDYWIEHARQRARAMATENRMPVNPGGGDLQDNKNACASVVVPCFNAGGYLEDTIQSLRAAPDAGEIIIVNDGSTDSDTLQQLDALDGRDRVRVIHTENLGVSAARMRGAAVAAGDCILFCDSDDTIHPDFIHNAIDVLRASPDVGIVYSWLRKFDGEDAVEIKWDFDLPWGLCKNAGLSMLMVRAAALRDAGGFDATMGNGFEDWEFLLNMVEHDWRVISIPEPLWYYRVRNDGMLLSMTRGKRALQMGKIMDRHQALYARHANEIIRLCQANTDFFQMYANPGLARMIPARDDTAATRAMGEALKELARKGLRRVVVYGAGKHSRKAIGALQNPPVEILAFADDAPAGEHFFGFPILTPQAAAKLNPDAVVISSDTGQEALLNRAASVFDPVKVDIITLY